MRWCWRCARSSTRWADDAAVTRVVITAAGGRAFSAGGDIRALYDLGKAGRHDEALQFWRDEYPLNAAIKNYRKPYVALIDGIAMGGGVGVSVHGSHRVAGDRFSFAMPEVGIGFFPDVGATWFLPRMPGELGTYCALTGERFGIGDAVAGGIATHRVPSARFPALLEGLTGTVSGRCGVVRLQRAGAGTADHGAPRRDRPAVRRRHGREYSRRASIVKRSPAARMPQWAQETAAVIRTKSPLSLKLALAQVRRGKHWDFETCMRMEFRIVSRVIHGHDFYEGVRAVIVDKDNTPRWRPSTLPDVDEAEVERHFAPLGPAELVIS